MNLAELENMDLSGIDLSKPVLADQLVKVRITEAKAVSADDDPNKLVRLEFTLVTEEAARDTKGQTVQPGFNIYHSLWLESKFDDGEKGIQSKIGWFQEAFLGKRGPTKLDQYLNRTARAQVYPQADKQEPDVLRTKVRRFVKE